MFKQNDKVRIISKNLICTVVDVSTYDGKSVYIVESDVKGKRTDGYGGIYPLFDCAEDELEKV